MRLPGHLTKSSSLSNKPLPVKKFVQKQIAASRKLFQQVNGAIHSANHLPLVDGSHPEKSWRIYHSILSPAK
jgi:hypothetical protein